MRWRTYRITLYADDGTETVLEVLLHRGRIIGMTALRGVSTAIVEEITPESWRRVRTP